LGVIKIDIVCDSSSVISLTSNCLLWIIGHLTEKLGQKFYISESVRKEITDVPFKCPKYKFKAIRVALAIRKGWLNPIGYDPKLDAETNKILEYANSIFKLSKANKKIEILHRGEAETLALVKRLGANIVIIDEKTTRLLLEDCDELFELIKKRSNSPVEMNLESRNKFAIMTKGINLLRSSEIVAFAFSRGFFDNFKSHSYDDSSLIEGLLFGLKYNGCAISQEEIDEYLSMFQS
jgi:hypothetical protein